MLRRTFTGLAAGLIAAPDIGRAEPPSRRRPLAEECRRELLLIPEYTLFDWIEVDPLIAGGIVVRGAATSSTKAAVMARFRRLAGTQTLRDECDVLPNSYLDERTRYRIYSALFGANSPLLKYATRAVPPIHILVSEQSVTLKGEVTQMAESMLALMRARNVTTVRSVRNELRVTDVANDIDD